MVKYCVKRIKINATKSLPAEKTAYSSAHLAMAFLSVISVIKDQPGLKILNRKFQKLTTSKFQIAYHSK